MTYGDRGTGARPNVRNVLKFYGRDFCLDLHARIIIKNLLSKGYISARVRIVWGIVRLKFLLVFLLLKS